MDNENLKKLYIAIINFTEECNSLGFEVSTSGSKDMVKLEICKGKERELELERSLFK